MISRTERFLPVLIVLAGLLPSAWLLVRFHDVPQLGVAGDDVMYIGTAQSLTQGSYREPVLPGNPWQTKFPPGYPLMLAAIMKLEPAIRGFCIIALSWIWLAAAAFALAWAMLQTGLSRLQSATVAGLWAANPDASASGILALAEAPYCAFLFLAVGLALRLGKTATGSAARAGAVLGVACLIRSAGLVAALALAIWLLWRRSPRTAIWFSACALVPPLIWTVWSRAHLPVAQDPITSFYLNYGGRWVQAVREIGLIPLLVTNITYGTMALGGWLIAAQSLATVRHVRDIILMTFGIIALTEWAGGAITAVALSTGIFHLFWHWPPNGRFFLSVAPAFLGAAVAMLSSRPVLVRIFALAIVAVADVYGTADLARLCATQREAGITPTYEFIRTKLPRDAIVLGDERVWLFTGRQAIGMPMPMEYFYLNQTDSEMTFFLSYKDVARRFGAGYLLLGPWDGIHWTVPLDRAQQFAAAVRSDPKLDRVFSQNGVELFRILP